MAQGKFSGLEGGQELSMIAQRDPFVGSLLQRMIDSVNALAQNAGVSAVGKLPAPPPIDSIQVQGTMEGNTHTAPSEILHWTLGHNQAIQKNIRYFTEVDTDPNFPSPHVVDHGTSRSGFLHLPTQDGDGNTQTYYMRAYSQMPGSDPSPHTTFGGGSGATKIVMTGGTNPSKTTLLPSKGSGTASPNGEQGGHGLGTVLTRPAPGPKRSIL